MTHDRAEREKETAPEQQQLMIRSRRVQEGGRGVLFVVPFVIVMVYDDFPLVRKIFFPFF